MDFNFPSVALVWLTMRFVRHRGLVESLRRGERNPQVLAQYRDPRCKDSKEVIAKSLEGNYKTTYIFQLQQALELYLYRLAGVDLTAVDGLGAVVVQSILSEIGVDMSKWPTEKHFAQGENQIRRSRRRL